MEKDYKREIQNVMKDIHSVPLLKQLLRDTKKYLKAEGGKSGRKWDEGRAAQAD